MPQETLRTTTLVATVALCSLIAPALVADHHQNSVADAVKAVIMEGNAYLRENLADQQGGISQHGSVEFWSSGGLMQWNAPDDEGSQYESFTLRAKHIKVIELPGGEAAVAMYYLEGSMQPKGRPAVSHYMTRVTQVFVKEDGAWVARAGHWSPIAGGSGTSQATVD